VTVVTLTPVLKRQVSELRRGLAKGTTVGGADMMNFSGMTVVTTVWQ
jgi:hypothetical protein